MWRSPKHVFACTFEDADLRFLSRHCQEEKQQDLSELSFAELKKIRKLDTTGNAATEAKVRRFRCASPLAFSSSFPASISPILTGSPR